MDGREQRNTASRDSADFFARCLDEHEGTLAVLTLPIEESFANHVCLSDDLRQLLSILHELKVHYESVAELVLSASFWPLSPRDL